MKIISVFIVSVVFSLSNCLALSESVAGGATEGAIGEAGKKHKVGVSLPLSGDGATYGVDIRNALEFANKELFRDSFEFVFEDDKCSGREASSIAQKLVNRDKVSVVLGLACSSAVLSAGPIYERNKVVAISSGAASPAISNLGDYIFRTWPSDVVSAKILYDYIVKNHKKIGILSEETDFPQGMLKAFLAQNTSDKLEIYNEDFLPNNRDFKSLLLKLRTKNVEAVFINPQSEKGLITIFKQLHQMNWPVAVYSNYYPSSSVFLNAFSDRADGIIFSDLPPLERTLGEKGRKLYEKYISLYEEPSSVDFLFVTAIASLQAVKELLESNKEPVLFLKQTDFSGVVGRFSFDESGDIVGISQILKVIKNGKAEILKF